MSSTGSPFSDIKRYAPREKIYVREATGRYTNWRWGCVWLTQLVFYGLPWLRWNGRPAVLFELAMRKFYLFGIVLWPQDFIYLAGLLMLCACLLFFLSAIGGRVWCSFACPHTVYSSIFMWIEHRIEGSRAGRMRLDQRPLSLDKAVKKATKHVTWTGLALWTGITLVAYFTPMQTLLVELGTVSLGPWESFWICFYAGLAYLNAGWMREQFCKYICAYARFQSVMFDRDTLLITYDQARGEPRGLRRKNRSPVAPRQGDCIDCTICVQVCPAGIDIRNGFQYECIDCAACIDACDTVMDKIGAARGLIRYSTANATQHGLSPREILRRLLRPRVLAYAGILCAGIALYATMFATRAPLKLDVMLDRSSAEGLPSGHTVENVYRLHLMNTDEQPHRYKIAVSGFPTVAIVGDNIISVGAAASHILPVRLRAMRAAGKPGANRIRFVLNSIDSKGQNLTENAVFVVPRD